MQRTYWHSAAVDLPKRKTSHLRPEDYATLADRERADEADANLISSETDAGLHMPAIDIDGIPVRIVPSSTPGNCHLYIDKAMDWHQYKTLLYALYEAGIIEPGYYAASVAGRMSFVRKPGHAKPAPALLPGQVLDEKGIPCWPDPAEARNAVPAVARAYGQYDAPPEDDFQLGLPAPEPGEPCEACQ